jgi:uncharacterized protein YjiS (DUF1127 family)
MSINDANPQERDAQPEMRAIMALTTSPMELAADGKAAVAGAKAPGFFARFFERLIQARMQQARVHVESYLSHLSDERLKDLGFSTDETKALRAKGTIPASYWG